MQILEQMYDTNKEHSRLVDVFGTTIAVPDWVTWVAVDSDNELWGYEHKPDMLITGGIDWWVPSHGRRAGEMYSVLYTVELDDGEEWDSMIAEVV